MNRKLLPHPGLLVDLIMGMLFPVCLGFRLMAEPVHEWLGLALFVLFGVHLWFNRRWFYDLFRGRYTLRRALNAFVILALLGLMLMLLAGGLMNAHLLKALELPGSMEHRMRHTLAAYWGLVCVGLHTGMQWHSFHAESWEPPAPGHAAAQTAALPRESFHGTHETTPARRTTMSLPRTNVSLNTTSCCFY